MDLLRNRYLVAPVFFVVALFLFDKIFLLPEVRLNFLQPGNMVYYLQRDSLMQEFRDRIRSEPERFSLAVFGDSRAYGVGWPMLLPRNDYPLFADWIFYTFASPQAVPAYHFRMTEKMLAGTVRPDAVLIGVSPDIFNRNSTIFADPVLTFGADGAFARRFGEQIPPESEAIYRLSRRFALVGLHFSFKELIDRLLGEWGVLKQPSQSPLAQLFLASLSSENLTARDRQLLGIMLRGAEKNLSLYRYDTNSRREMLDVASGGEYAWFGVASPSELREETRFAVDFYLGHYEASEEQFWFFEEMLRLLDLAGVDVILFVPRVNPYLRAALTESEPIRSAQERIELLAVEYGATFYDLNDDESVSCDHYYDATHLSFTCFPEITGFLVDQLLEKRSGRSPLSVR